MSEEIAKREVSRAWVFLLCVPYRCAWAFVLGKHFEWFGPRLGYSWGFVEAFCLLSIAFVFAVWVREVPDAPPKLTLERLLLSPVAAVLTLGVGWLMHVGLEAFL